MDEKETEERKPMYEMTPTELIIQCSLFISRLALQLDNIRELGIDTSEANDALGELALAAGYMGGILVKKEKECQ